MGYCQKVLKIYFTRISARWHGPVNLVAPQVFVPCVTFQIYSSYWVLQGLTFLFQIIQISLSLWFWKCDTWCLSWHLQHFCHSSLQDSMAPSFVKKGTHCRSIVNIAAKATMSNCFYSHAFYGNWCEENWGEKYILNISLP